MWSGAICLAPNVFGSDASFVAAVGPVDRHRLEIVFFENGMLIAPDDHQFFSGATAGS
jgi:hypothetical protein